MAKAQLHLSIDLDLHQAAKNSNLNLSAEFEEFLKFRLKQASNINISDVDYDLEIAKHKQEIESLLRKKSVKTSDQEQLKELNAMLDRAIDNSAKFLKEGETVKDIPHLRAQGITYLYKQKYKKEISNKEAATMLEKRINERDLLESDETKEVVGNA